MALNVRATWLVMPIIVILCILIGAVYTLNKIQVEQSTSGYDYKEELFKEDEVGLVEINVSDAKWQTILDDPTAEEYVEASISINGTTYDNVGIRAKGNSSLTSVANSDSERYSLKLDFAQYNSNQTYYGLEKINLNNNISDTTQMKEFVSYELMEQLGIVTPVHSYVKVMVNGEYYGLMLAVEEIGEAFAKTNYGSTEGYIFKPEGDGSDLAYVSDSISDYAGIFDEVKMNEKTAEKNSNIINMMKEISEGDTSSIDIDQVARYFALNTALVSMDSYQGSFKHNYYLYENGEGEFSVIPWDYNMSFGGFGGGGGGPQGGLGGNNQVDQNTDNAQQNTNQNAAPASGKGMTPPTMEAGQMQQPPSVENNTKSDAQTDTKLANNMPQMNGGQGGMGGGGLMMSSEIITDSNINFSITEPVSGTTVDERPLLKIILEDEEARALYDSYLEKIATEILTEENVQAITSKLGELLLDAVEEDPSKFATTEQFLEGVSGDQSLAEFAKQRSESILKQLSGEIEGVSGAGTSQFGGMDGKMPDFNGEMPNFENMPQMNGENAEDANAAQGANGQQGNRAPPNMNGQQGNVAQPDMDGQQGNAGPPNIDGKQVNGIAQDQQQNSEQAQTNGEQQPDANAEQGVNNAQQNGGMPPGGFGGNNAVGDPANMNVKKDQVSTVPVKQTMTILGVSLGVVLLGILAVLFISKRKYKKG
jgi:spore coat protein CotH